MPMRVPPGLGRYKRTVLGAALMALFACLALLRPVLHLYIHTPPENAIVARVTSADTIVLADGRRVRYLGIEAPSASALTAGDRLLAEEAKEYNANLVLGRHVRLEYDSEVSDRYGRTLAYVWIGDEMANAKLVEAGLAKANNYGSRNLKRWDELEALQARAKDAHAGIWAPKSRTRREPPAPQTQSTDTSVQPSSDSTAELR